MSNVEKKIYDIVYRQIVYLIYTSRSFGLTPKADVINRVRRSATTIKLSNIIAYLIATLISGFISKFSENAPLAFTFLDLIIFANMITSGLNVIFFVNNYDLRTFLLTLPLTESQVSRAIVRGVFEFFYQGFLISVILSPIITFVMTSSILQSLLVELEVLFFFSLSFSLVLFLGKRIKLGIASTLFRVGTSFIWILFVIFPSYQIIYKSILPIYFLPIFPFDFMSIYGFLLSIIYVLLSISSVYRQVASFAKARIEVAKFTKYSIKLRKPIFAYLYKDVRGLVRVPQASFLLAIPIFAVIFTLILQQYSIFYLIFMITTSSITMILIEASGIQLLLTLPSGLMNSFLSKLIIISLIYFISALIFTVFTGRLTGIILLPSTIASIETSLLISYNSVLKGRGIRIADPISLIIREIEINAIVGIAIVLLYINLLSSILFSLIVLIIINLIVTKKIR